MNGCELARCILDDAHLPFPDIGDAMYLDKSPEYWAGWALAYYQWYSNLSFYDIFRGISLEGIIQMYPVYHQMDLSHFVDHLNSLILKKFPQTRLRELRKSSGMSQTELSEYAEVPLRQIQLFEQGQRDINKTSAITLYKLSKALYCRMEDLINPEIFL